MHVLVTGGAGFIGSHVADKLIQDSHDVVVVDNLASGSLGNIEHLLEKDAIEFHQIDACDSESLRSIVKGVDMVYHLAANPDVRFSNESPDLDFQRNVVVTWTLLRSMADVGVRKLVFASSSTVYGETKVLPTPEDYAPVFPISLYGTTKLACEALVSGFAQTFGIQALIVRPSNIIGSRQTHGVILDFLRKLKASPNRLEILGDGSQRKSYLHISDFANALQVCCDHFFQQKKVIDVFNIGNRDWISVRELANTVIKTCNLGNIQVVAVGGDPGGRGWLGDVVNSWLDISKLESVGWRPRLDCVRAIRRATEELAREPTLGK